MNLLDLYKYSEKVYGSENRFSVYRNRFRFCFWYLVNPKAMKTLKYMFEDSYKKSLFDLNPDSYLKMIKPYLCSAWSKDYRLKSIAANFDFISTKLGHVGKQTYSKKGYTLFSIQGSFEDEYDVILYNGGCLEGSLGIAIVNNQGQHVYVTTFCITSDHSLFIGCIQGPKRTLENRSACIKSLTKAQHGIRPKSLVLEFALMFARNYRIENVYCVSNNGHIYNSLGSLGKKRQQEIYFDYDLFCSEHGGVKECEGKFKLPIERPRRDLNLLNKTKRKMYQKRYEKLTVYEESIKLSLQVNTGCNIIKEFYNSHG